MADENDTMETFEISEAPSESPTESREEPQMMQSPTQQQRSKCLHVTIVDHNPILEGSDEESYINLRIPLDLADDGLKMIPDHKWGQINPSLIVRMVESGIDGEIVNITEEKKTVTVRVE
jgi:hypothetical protein